MGRSCFVQVSDLNTLLFFFNVGHRTCPLLKSLENGITHGQQYSEGKHVSFTCNPGYWLQGIPERSVDLILTSQNVCHFQAVDYVFFFFFFFFFFMFCYFLSLPSWYKIVKTGSKLLYLDEHYHYL